MDVHVDETKVSHSKKCNNLHKASLVLSVLAILLTIALFLRMEISTQMLEVKVTLEIQEIKETLKSVKDARFPNRVNDHLDASSGRWYNFYIFSLIMVIISEMIHRLGFFAVGVDLAITYHLMHMDIMIQNPLSLNSRDRSGLKARYLH